MTHLIPLQPMQINGDTVETVNARALHTFLENGDHFTTWMKDRISQYGFVEGTDFTTYSENTEKPRNGRPAIEYALTLDMAKELAMVERNEKGKEARAYFLDCERRAKSNVVDIGRALADPDKLRALLLGYTEKVIALEQRLVAAAPKVEFHDAVCEAINGQTVQEVAKVLGTGQNRLFRWLRAAGLLMPNNQPYQSALDAGHFRMVERQYRDPRGEIMTYTRTLVTGKGLAYIQKRFHNAEAA